MSVETKVPVPATPTRRRERRPPYERDFYAWTLDQAAAIRAGRLAELDRESLAEEIEDLGEEVFEGLRTSLRIILVHMLKWDHQPTHRSRGWTSVATQRIDVDDMLAKNPSLRRRLPEAAAHAHRRARIEAAAEMDRPIRSLPPECPYALDEIMNRPVLWPDE